MAAYRVLDSGLEQNQVTIRSDEISDNSVGLNQITHGKLPKYLSVVRRRITSLANTGGVVDLVSETFWWKFKLCLIL